MPAHIARPTIRRANHAPIAPGLRVSIRPNYPGSGLHTGIIERICYKLQLVWLKGERLPYSIPNSTIEVLSW
jgi:hypothetical protein